ELTGVGLGHDDILPGEAEASHVRCQPDPGQPLTRILLVRAGIIPLRLRPFLDLAVDRALLLRTGGGHTFLHRLLLEYFADLEPPGVPDGYTDSLPTVDLRPDAVLMRALDAAQKDLRLDVLPMLAYAETVLPPEVWATGAMRIVEAIEDQLKISPNPAIRAVHLHNLVAICQMVIVAEHTELSPIAAIHLGELLVREPTPKLQDEV
ncbi:hypothetical protein ACIA5G_47985, partial [Amycolatopsis sp. NPDC051758]|uniref:hypothetical protein n=1 Tax=Amycolatopsis sp. NPDC051758 TaxID=3363935 RepID=UPI0037BA9551